MTYLEQLLAANLKEARRTTLAEVEKLLNNFFDGQYSALVTDSETAECVARIIQKVRERDTAWTIRQNR